MHYQALQMSTARAEDRATLRSDPSADPGAKTEARAAHGDVGCPTSRLRDWRQSDKPSRQDAATRMAGCPYQFANAPPPKFQFPLNQDTCSGRPKARPLF
jgi:hypothetical protein